MVTLEEILQRDFNCKKPFYDEPQKLLDGETEYFTTDGGAAYSRLTRLFYDIGALVEIDMDEVVERLDQIVNEEC